MPLSETDFKLAKVTAAEIEFAIDEFVAVETEDPVEFETAKTNLFVRLDAAQKFRGKCKPEVRAEITRLLA